MSTPAHIVPEWYFLWVYAILRSIPNKLGGVLAIVLVFIALFALPWLSKAPVRCSLFRPIYQKFFWLFAADCVLLGWVGAQPVEPPFVEIGQVASICFFLYFLILLPLCVRIEQSLVVRDQSTNSQALR